MAANIYQKTLTLTGDWQTLAPASLVLNATLQAAPDNYGPAEVRINADDAGIAGWFPGANAFLQHVDLGVIEVKGNAGDRFLVVASSA